MCVYILVWQHCLGSATGLPKHATTKRWRRCYGESRSNKDNAGVRAVCSMLCGGPPAYLCGVCVAIITIALPVVLLWWILSLSLAAHSSVALAACPHTRRVSMIPAHTRRRAWPVTRQATGAHLCGAMCVMHFLGVVHGIDTMMGAPLAGASSRASPLINSSNVVEWGTDPTQSCHRLRGPRGPLIHPDVNGALPSRRHCTAA